MRATQIDVDFSRDMHIVGSQQKRIVQEDFRESGEPFEDKPVLSDSIKLAGVPDVALVERDGIFPGPCACVDQRARGRARNLCARP